MSRPRSQLRRKSSNGSALLSAVVAASILGILLATYLTWVTSEHRLTRRSHAWAQALQLAESAAELGLAELNSVYASNPGQAFLSANGWQPVGSAGARQKTVMNFTNAKAERLGNFVVTVSNLSGPTPIIQAVGTCNNISGTPISRAVQIVARKGGSTGYAFFCKDLIDFGGTTQIDSYDSTDPAKSTDGYYDAAKRQPNATCGVLYGSLDMNTTDLAGIYGTVKLSTGGIFTMGSNSSVGPSFDPSLRATSVASAVSRGYLTYDITGSLPDVNLPAALTTAPLLSDIKSSVTLNPGDYRVAKIGLSGSSALTITNGLVRLYVTGTASLSGSSMIIVAGNAVLELYLASDLSCSGNGIVNMTGRPINCKILGLNSCTKMDMTGSSATYALVYAPYAAIKITGGSDRSFNGAIYSKSVVASGTVIMHYDESLFGSGKAKILSWQELRNVSGNWVP